MVNEYSDDRLALKAFWARLFDVVDRYGILMLGVILAVYPFLFAELNEAIFAAEDADKETLTQILTTIRGFVPSTPLMIQILIYALFGISFNIILGNTGMLSLGHSAFFGVGGYTLGLMHAWFRQETSVPAWITNTFVVLPLECSLIAVIIV